jgi:hypothetical protein
VYPDVGEELSVPFTASEIPLEGKLFGMLKEIFDGSESECNIDIRFISDNQQNDMRDSLLNLIEKRDAESAGEIARRLSRNTTRRSHIGLFFVILAKSGKKNSVVLSRFPTDQAILADDDGNGLNVEFLEKVFVKKWSSYKGAIFSDHVSRQGFWTGRVVDRQINATKGEASLYWVEKFLSADFVATSYLGTHRFAKAVSAASRAAKPENAVEEINSIVPFLRQFDGKATSVIEIGEKLGLSEGARAAIQREMPSNTVDQVFKLDYDLLRNTISFRTYTTDKGVTITADSLDFQDVVSVSGKDSDQGIVTISTTGRIISDRLRKAR